MSSKVLSACGGGLLLALTSGAAAGGTWVEVDDAPDWPAAATWQTTVGQGPLTTITGVTELATGDLVDGFGITITDPAAFFATTSALFDPNGTASFDTRLWLFNLDGTPVPGNHDAPGATFNVPGPGMGTLVVVGVIGLVGRNRRRRVHA